MMFGTGRHLAAMEKELKELSRMIGRLEGRAQAHDDLRAEWERLTAQEKPKREPYEIEKVRDDLAAMLNEDMAEGQIIGYLERAKEDGDEATFNETCLVVCKLLKMERLTSVVRSLAEDASALLPHIVATDAITLDAVIRVHDEIRALLDTTLHIGRGAPLIGAILAAMDADRSDRAIARLRTILADDPEFFDEILYWIIPYDDIAQLDDGSIQVLLRQTEKDTLVLALKGSNDAVQEKWLSNMSERACRMVMEDMEAMGAARLRDVDEAQKRIVMTLRELIQRGEVVWGDTA